VSDRPQFAFLLQFFNHLTEKTQHTMFRRSNITDNMRGFDDGWN
jgi:hypothetical protein